MHACVWPAEPGIQWGLHFSAFHTKNKAVPTHHQNGQNDRSRVVVCAPEGCPGWRSEPRPHWCHEGIWPVLQVLGAGGGRSHSTCLSMTQALRRFGACCAGSMGAHVCMAGVPLLSCGHCV